MVGVSKIIVSMCRVGKWLESSFGPAVNSQIVGLLIHPRMLGHSHGMPAVPLDWEQLCAASLDQGLGDPFHKTSPSLNTDPTVHH